MSRRFQTIILLVTAILTVMPGLATAEEIAVNSGVDLYSRYIWRGLDIASTPSVQPALSVAYSGFELGAWAAYTLSNESSASDEIDFWLGYTLELEKGASVTALATDYYFPNAGIPFSNFNNYDAVKDSVPDPGAHTIELGLSFTGPDPLPVTLSGYVNVYNDAGNNTYFQLDYPFKVGEVDLGIFCGVAGGSKDNPDYYGASKAGVINVGVTANRDIAVSDRFSVPLTVSLIVNPKVDISYLVVGMSF
jgi:uncharacterized protein (TIGR02001 family)